MLARAASELHRGPAHQLAAALMLLRLCERELGERPDEARVLLDRSTRRVQAALRSVRTAIDTLQHPGDRPGLARAVTALVEDLQASGGPKVRLEIGDLGPLSAPAEDALTIVGCEALANASRHAGARHIDVRVHRQNGVITLVVCDDGRGFDQRGARPRRGGGLGLTLMREQIRRVGGTLCVERRPEGGTLVAAAVRLPVDETSPVGTAQPA